MDPLNRTNEYPETIVYWAPSPGADKFGQQRVTAPQETVARWETSSNLRVADFLLQEGATESVMTPIELPIGTILWRGELEAVSATSAPLYRVIASDTVPDLKGQEIDYSAVAVRYNETIPTMV